MPRRRRRVGRLRRRLPVAAALAVLGPAAVVALLTPSALPGAVATRTLSGRAAVVDGDTLDIGGERVRLLHIDAPEAAQPHGPAATRHLAGLVRGRTVTCIGEAEDGWGRLLAVCTAGGTDLGRAMVAAGAAAVFRRHGDSYDAEERAARAAHLGIWADPDPVMPWDYRAAHRPAAAPAEAAPDAGSRCTIKGNVSAKGARIYHLPSSRTYAETRISTAKGERWFCTEAEARAAGWRPARD